MNIIKREHELISLAFEAFKEILPEIEIQPIFEKEDGSSNLNLELIYREKKHEFNVIQKRNISDINALNTLVKMLNADKNLKETILVSEYISRNTAYLLKKNNILFLDTVGNAYIKAGDLLIFTADKKRGEKAAVQKSKRAFYTSGLKTIFNLLVFPELINQPYRTTVKISKASLGSIGWIFQDLKKMGYVIQIDKKQKKLINKDKLFEKWIEGYGEKLRPNLLKGRYRPTNKTLHELLKNSQDITIKFPDTFRGGEAAAELCTDYLKPENLTLYSADNILELIKTLKLVPDKTGPVEILEIFWDIDYYKKNIPQNYKAKIVPYHLIYADLVISGDERNLEGAKYLYEKHIQHLL